MHNHGMNGVCYLALELNQWTPLRNVMCIVVITSLMVIVCARKAPPLSKDRLHPKLVEARVLNNRQLQFTFSEEIDTLMFDPGNVSITSDTDTLKIFELYPSLSAAEIIAITDVQSEKMYEVSGFVFDTAGNKGSFKKTFKGSTQRDTISPWLIDYSEGAEKSDFLLQFSEAMDTSFIEFAVLPKKQFSPLWHNIRTCQLIAETARDSLQFDTTYYLYINKGARDISGNAVGLFITSITPDTIYSPLGLRGKAMVNDTLVQSGLAVISKDIVLGIAEVQKGEFAFDVRDSSTYTVLVVSGKFSGSNEVSVAQDNIVILKEEERNIDSIIH
ncbi:MAG: hypothetical protein JSV97_11490 [candidate division WOR-3 bacterium]|nr:MAG: hypothetical protein JSV97_11490 [candidate division WOR-3 bacterium]